MMNDLIYTNQNKMNLY